jgi:hypothetical protein
MDGIPRKPQRPCGGLGAHPARRHVPPAHTAGVHSHGPTEALVPATWAPRGGPWREGSRLGGSKTDQVPDGRGAHLDP